MRGKYKQYEQSRGVVRGGARGARAPPQFWGLAPQKMRKIKTNIEVGYFIVLS